MTTDQLIYVYYDDEGKILSYSKNSDSNFEEFKFKMIPFKFMKKFYNGLDTRAFTVDTLTIEGLHSEEVKNSKYFCMAPWVALHTAADGKILPCCASPPQEDYDWDLGKVRTTSLKEAWNSSEMRKLRVNMVTDTKSKACTRCYAFEDLGLSSYRQALNYRFMKHYDVVKDTLDDGTLENMNLKYWDFRFSNICNFKCRTCGPHYSSKWLSDALKLYGKQRPTDQSWGGSKADGDSILEQILPFAESVEEIYFAGGEPLITPQHYEILNLLIDMKKFDVRLFYNTNMSTLTFQGQNVLDLWKKFKTVKIGASLDGNYKRGEYLRTGQIWSETISNTKEIKKVTPHVKFELSPNISIMNSFNLLDFHKEWVELGLINVEDICLNLVLGPEYYRIDILPEHIKKILVERYKEHIKWINQHATSRTVARRFEAIIEFIQKEDNSHHLPDFVSMTNKVDEIRDEKFVDVFPELKELFID